MCWALGWACCFCCSMFFFYFLSSMGLEKGLPQRPVAFNELQDEIDICFLKPMALEPCFLVWSNHNKRDRKDMIWKPKCLFINFFGWTWKKFFKWLFVRIKKLVNIGRLISYLIDHHFSIATREDLLATVLPGARPLSMKPIPPYI